MNRPLIAFAAIALLEALCLVAAAGDSALSGGQQMPAYVKRTGESYAIGNRVIERQIQAPVGGRLATVALVNRLTRERLATGGDEFRLALGERTLTAADLVVRSVEERANGSLDVVLKGGGLEVTVAYNARDGDNYLTKTLTVTNSSSRPVTLDGVWVEALTIPPGDRRVRANGLSPYAGFIRGERGGFFVCLAFPYMEMKLDNGLAEVGFPPHQQLSPKARLVSHEAVFGAYRFSGGTESAGTVGLVSAEDLKPGELVWTPGTAANAPALSKEAIDLGESEAWRYCIERLYPSRAKDALLMNGRFCEGNMVDLRERWGGGDAAYWNGYLDIVRRDLEDYADLGFNGAVFGPEPTAWKPDNPDPKELDRLLALGRRLGVRLGLYTNSNSGPSLGPYWGGWGIEAPYPWKVPGGGIVTKEGKTLDLMCWASPKFRKVYSDYYLTQVRRGFSGLWHDFTFIQPCYAGDHGHVPGDVYQQVRCLMDFMEECEKAQPRMVNYGFLGWGNLLPHGARHMSMFYVADPWMDLPIPSLSQSKLFADSRRAQMRKFALEGLPTYAMANMDFFCFPDSVVPEYLAYQYVILQGLAITPNWSTFGPEFLRDVPHKEYQTAVDFIRFWNRWRSERWEIIKNLKVLSPAPGIGVLEAYMHTDGERGYLFLVNPNSFSQSRELTVDQSIGLTKGRRFWLKEWCPERMWRIVNGRPIIERGDKVLFEVPPSSVLVLEFIPAGKGRAPKVWGVPVAESVSPKSLRFERKVGVTREIGLALPSGEEQARVMVDGKPAPSAVRDGVVIFRDVPPPGIAGERAKPEMREWVIRAESLPDGVAKGYQKGIAGEPTRFPLPSVLDCPQPSSLLDKPSEVKFEGGNVGKFLGAYVFNTDIWGLRGPGRYAQVVLESGKPSAGELSKSPAKPAAPGKVELPACKEYWASGEISLPIFNNTLAENSLPYSEHLYILLPFVDYHSIAELKAWINGREARVDSMGYYRSAPGQPLTSPDPEKYNFAYYVDGTKWGLQGGQKNSVVICARWK